MFNHVQARWKTSPDGAPGINMCGVMAYGEVHYFVDGYFWCRCGRVVRDYPFHPNGVEIPPGETLIVQVEMP